MFKNSEGYHDPTAGEAYYAICRKERRQAAERMDAACNLIGHIRGIAALAGFRVVGRIVLKDKATGKEYRSGENRV